MSQWDFEDIMELLNDQGCSAILAFRALGLGFTCLGLGELSPCLLGELVPARPHTWVLSSLSVFRASKVCGWPPKVAGYPDSDPPGNPSAPEPQTAL